MNDLVGVWRLVEIVNRDANGNLLRSSYGPKKMGIYMFTEEGRCMVVLCDGRPEIPPEEGEREYTSYAGAYHFDGKTLYVDVDCSTPTNPSRIGTRQVRPARFHDGNRVTLTAPPAEINGVVNYRELTWEKIA